MSLTIMVLYLKINKNMIAILLDVICILQKYSILLDNPRVREEITRRIRKYFELNDNENSTH